MKLTATQLIKLNVKYVIHEKELYFDILEVKKFFPEKKFPPEKIKKLYIDGAFLHTIRPQDIEDMTDFDKNIVKFAKYNSK